VTPERLAAIEALVEQAFAPGKFNVSGTPPKPYGIIELHRGRAVPDLCQALREAWAEIGMVCDWWDRRGRRGAS